MDMKRIKEGIKDFIQFFTKDLWHPNAREHKGFLYHFDNIIRIIQLATRGFQNNKLIIIASALTYFTVLAFIPLMSIMLGIAKGFNFQDYLQNVMLNTFPGQVEVLNFVFSLVEQVLSVAANGVVVGIGLIFIFWSVWAIVNNLERAFNMVWGLQNRKFYRKLGTLLAVIFLFPILLVISSGVSIYLKTALDSSPLFEAMGPLNNLLIKLIPYVLSWLLFTLMYIILPNTKVKFKNAAVAGLIAGVAFQIFQYLYINGQIWVSRYNALYGSFAAIPLLLLWLQLTWTIVLMGAEMTYASQNLENFFYEKEISNVSNRYHYFFAIVMMGAICRRFEKGESPLSCEQLSRSKHIPLRLASIELEHLKNAGLVTEVPDEKNNRLVYFQPAMDIHQITVGLVMEKLFRNGAENFNVDIDEFYSGQWKAICEVEQSMRAKGDETLVKDL